LESPDPRRVEDRIDLVAVFGSTNGAPQKVNAARRKNLIAYDRRQRKRFIGQNPVHQILLASNCFCISSEPEATVDACA
jgi:hypothetical protein